MFEYKNCNELLLLVVVVDFMLTSTPLYVRILVVVCQVDLVCRSCWFFLAAFNIYK